LKLIEFEDFRSGPAERAPCRIRQRISGCCENVHGALEVVGDGGEVDLGGGFGEASPSHSAQAVRTLPGSEDLLDPATHAVDRLVPFVELALCFLLVTPPHAGRDDPGDATLRPDRITKVSTAVGAVCEDLAWIVRQGLGTGFAIVDIGRRDRDFLDQRRVGI